MVSTRPLLLANVGLMVRHAQVLGPVLGRNLHPLPAAQRGIDHPLIHALGVHVDFYWTAACRNTLEHGFPEIVTALRDSAFTVYTKRDSADLRHSLEQSSDSVTAVRALVPSSETFNCVIRIRARVPTVAMRPNAQLEIHAARDRLLADEAEHLQVAIAFGVRQLRHAHAIPGH